MSKTEMFEIYVDGKIVSVGMSGFVAMNNLHHYKSKYGDDRVTTKTSPYSHDRFKELNNEAFSNGINIK